MKRTILAAIIALALPAIAAEPAHQAPLMRDFMGIDGHFSFKPNLYRPTCGLVRNYHPTAWDLGNDTSLAPTFPFARNKVDWAATYGAWKKGGFQIDACLQFESIAQPKWKIWRPTRARMARPSRSTLAPR